MGLRVGVVTGVGADGYLVADVVRPPGGGQHRSRGRHAGDDDPADAGCLQQLVQVRGGEGSDGGLAQYGLVPGWRQRGVDLVAHPRWDDMDHGQPRGPG